MTFEERDLWQKPFQELVLELEPTSAPPGEKGEWALALARFTRSHFLRLLVRTDRDEPLTLFIEIGLSAKDEGLSHQLVDFLSEREVDLQLQEPSTFPWLISGTLPVKTESDLAVVRRLLTRILKVADFLKDSEGGAPWSSLVRNAEQKEDQTRSPSSSSPFETIGNASTSRSASVGEEDKNATIIAFGLTGVKECIHLAIGFGEVLTGEQLQALQSGLESEIRGKFGSRVIPSNLEDRAELKLPAMARSRLLFAVTDEGSPLDVLRKDLETWLERLKTFSGMGVDLFEVLGVGETILDQGFRESRKEAFSDSYGVSRHEEYADDSAEVVLGLGSARFGATANRETEFPETTLIAKNYSDPRLHQGDAETPLVDLVLRHPGYSDRRIGQVLSILLDIEYSAALALAESAPCILARAMGQERARSFKQVIESAGGKAVLVEPGQFSNP